MNRSELQILVRELTEITKQNSSTMEALTFQIRDFQADLDVLKNKNNQYITRINWLSKKYVSLQRHLKAQSNGAMSQEDFDNMFPTGTEEIN